jgi:hypothetical protein
MPKVKGASTVTLALAFLAACPAQEANPRVAEFDASHLTAMEALAKLSAQTGVPLGVEWLGAGPGPLISRRWKNARLKDIGRQIAAEANPRWSYRANLTGGVLEVRPSPSLRRGHSVADLRLHDFRVTSGGSQPYASRRLIDQLHCALLPPCGGTEIILGGGAGGEIIPARTFENPAVSEILDYLVAAGRTIKLWVLVEDPGHYIGRSKAWRTLYPATLKPVPASLQPWWTLLPWRAMPDFPGPPRSEWACPKCWSRPRARPPANTRPKSPNRLRRPPPGHLRLGRTRPPGRRSRAPTGA